MPLVVRIKKIRKLLGLDQTSVARSLQISQQTYHSFESNADNANIETLRKLCNVLEVDISFLIAEDIPITAESLTQYRGRNFYTIISAYEKKIARLELLLELEQNKK